MRRPALTCGRAGPAENENFFAQLLASGGGQSRPEQIKIHNFVSSRPGEVGQDLPRADHHTQIGRLITDDVRQLRAGPEERAKVVQVTQHAAKIKFRDARVEPFKARGLAQFDAAAFDGGGDALNLFVLIHHAVVGVAFVHAARV